MTSILSVLPYVQIGLSALLVAIILIQTSETSLGSAFGGEGFSGFHTRRGFDKVVFIATIIIAILFAASALLSLIYA